MLHAGSILISQIVEWDDTPAPPPPAPARPMNFSDLQHGFQQWNSNDTAENVFRDGMLVVVAIVLLVALAVYLRQRLRVRKPLNSQLRLGLELARLVPFPFGSRVMLWWVARSTHTHFATLLISAPAFQKSVNAWSAQPTFAMLRRWGHKRLQRLGGVLFSH